MFQLRGWPPMVLAFSGSPVFSWLSLALARRRRRALVGSQVASRTKILRRNLVSPRLLRLRSLLSSSYPRSYPRVATQQTMRLAAHWPNQSSASAATSPALSSPPVKPIINDDVLARPRTLGTYSARPCCRFAICLLSHQPCSCCSLLLCPPPLSVSGLSGCLPISHADLHEFLSTRQTFRGEASKKTGKPRRSCAEDGSSACLCKVGPSWQKHTSNLSHRTKRVQY
ncbi:hypothetical protein F4780DRAFT_725343 [Xylariomycetidae sp. FL0641]|nr:hypothetical protein F4780DRAFT_725343 [Xylariomycetidae sp. FL0641]